MHQSARDFTLYAKQVCPVFFTGVTCLDAGGGDINGNNSSLFENSEYHCNDVYRAPNVTVVCRTAELPFNDGHFDTVISTESFEHDPEYKESLSAITRKLKPGGLFVFTCASTGRAEHGTRRTTPSDSWGTVAQFEDMQDYYKNLTITDVRDSGILEEYEWARAYYSRTAHDLYFIAKKKGGDTVPPPIDYTGATRVY